MQQESVLAPRLKHNRDLSAKYLSDNGIYARWPRVSKQCEFAPLDLSAIPKHAYNPSIIDHNGMTLMAYRFHEGTLATRLGVAHINDAGKVLNNRVLNIAGASCEDPKLFSFGGKVGMSWVDSTWPQSPPTSVVRFGAFKDGTIGDFQTPNIGRNDGSTLEKNWVLFEHQDSLFCIHRCSPQHIYQRDRNAWTRLLPEVQSPRWPYGEIRGGTVPIPHEGKLLRFFHSALDNEYGPQPRRYFVGAYLMESTPPFKVVRVSKRPILFGSELCDIPVSDRKGIIQYKVNVVFPGGAVARKDHWLLAIGINDSACALARITPTMLNL